MRRTLPILLALAVLPTCKGEDRDDKSEPAPEITAPEPHLRRLTREQYEVSVTALLGDELVMPAQLEPDTPIDGKLAVGAATTSVSSWGAERYEDASFLLAEQAMADDAWVEANIGCPIEGAGAPPCARDFLGDFALRAWRRPPSSAELDRLVGVVGDVAGASADPHLALTYAISAVLQSPYFLYRVELGEPDPDRPGQRRLNDWETATRLAFLLWNAPPDRALLDAVKAGELSTEAGLRETAERMMEDERYRDGIRAIFTDIFELYRLDGIVKDPTVFTHASPELGPSAREETLRLIADNVIDREADFRDLMTTRRTFVDQRLAALYDIPAPEPEGFGMVMLPMDGTRRGLLGHAGLLQLHAHSGTSSSTLRGVFVRQTLLCQSIPPPPAGLNTAIPEPDADSPTLRERMRSHQEEPACAVCHATLDPIGLGLENFDGIGRWRETENGATIDASGDLDGAPFDDAWDLAHRIQQHEAFVPCWAEHLVEVATAHPADGQTEPWIDWLAGEFELADYSYRSLVLATVTSPGFRQVGEVDQ